MKLRYLLALPLLAVGLRAAAPAPAPVQTVAKPGPWTFRLSAAYLVTSDAKDDKAASLPPIHVEDKLIPQFDIDYRINDSWAIELKLTVPQEHDVKLGGAHIGNFKHLPPSLLAKYTLGDFGGFRPYVGAGANFTLIFDENLRVGPTRLKLDNYSVGPVGQIGCDYRLDERWSLNVDVKRAMLRTDVKAGGVELTELHVDPWLFRVGVGYAF